LVLFSSSARAWVESEVRSHVATIDVDRAGIAVVTQDLTLAVRGGPLPGIELAGVDLDAEPLPDATVSAVSGTKAQLSPTPLLVEKRDDGTLRIEIDRDKGLRTGVYLFHFQYRTNLLARDLIRREGNEAEVRWVGPRFNQGIDSARALFRLPAGPLPPTLPSADASAGRIDDSDALGGVFIGNLHRLADKDELDIVRPHVSRGEPVVWRVRTSAKVFDALSKPVPSPHSVTGAEAPRALGIASALQPRQRLTWWLCAALGALAYAFAVAGKWRIFSDLCRARGATPRALVRLPVGPRAAASGTALAAAFVSAAWFDQATLGAGLLTLAMALAAQYALPAKVVLRGPGQWLPLSESEAFARSTERSPGRFLDAGTWSGLAVLGLLCASFCGAALLLFARTPYQALLLLLGSPCLLPLFFTGRAAQLPADPATRPRAVLESISKKLRRHGIKVVPWARIPERRHEADELRLLVQVQGAIRGLVSVEVGVEYSAGVAGSGAALFVLVRAREGSRAIHALPHALVWTRGRKAEERAAVLRPRLPTRAQCVDLVLELARLLREEQPSSTRHAPAGRGTPAKPGRVVSPAHVM
jgi:hypothetical protein